MWPLTGYNCVLSSVNLKFGEIKLIYDMISSNQVFAFRIVCFFFPL